jgi:hypothetical protein
VGRGRDRLGQSRDLLRRRCAAVAVEDRGDDKLQEQGRQLVQARLQLTASGQDRGQRDAFAHQGGGGVEQSAADMGDTLAIDLDVAEADRFGKDLRCQLARQHCRDIGNGHRHGFLIRPRRGHRPLETEQVGQAIALLPGREQLTDPAEGVAAVEQLADEPQAVQVSLRVPADPSLAPRRGKQLPLLVVAHRADRDPGLAGEFADAVLRCGRGVARRPARVAGPAICRFHLRKHRRPSAAAKAR